MSYRLALRSHSLSLAVLVAVLSAGCSGEGTSSDDASPSSSAVSSPVRSAVLDAQQLVDAAAQSLLDAGGTGTYKISVFDDRYTYTIGDGRFNMQTPAGWQSLQEDGGVVEVTIDPDGSWITVDAQRADGCWADTKRDNVVLGKYTAVLPATRFLLAPRALGMHPDDDPSGSLRVVRVEVGADNTARMLMFQGLGVEPVTDATIPGRLTLQDGEFRQLTLEMKDLTDALLASSAALSPEQREAARQLRELGPVTIEVLFSGLGEPVTITPPSVDGLARCSADKTP